MSARWSHNHFTRDVKPRGECVGCDYTVGQGVVYRPHPGADPEQGYVTGVNAPAGLVYVRYGSDQHSKATRADDLEPLLGGEGR